MTKSIKGWHFLRKNCRLTHGDGRLIRPGTTVTVPGPPVLCARGLHASRRVMNALQLAPGPVICRVVVSGKIVKEDGIFVGTRRYVEWMLDATWLLHEFACWCAERALRRANIKNEVLWAAIAAKRAWLADEITDEQLETACLTADSFARSTTPAYSPAYSAARSAAYSAASSAPAFAARSAASSAARCVAYSTGANSAIRSVVNPAAQAPYAAETEAQERKLLRMFADAPEQ